MSGPITWRNVQGRSSNVGGLLGIATRATNNAIDNFQGALDENVANREQVAGQERQDNTDAYLAELQKFDGVDALEQNRGAIEEFGASLGGNVDRELMRTGFDDRLTDLRNEELATSAFDNKRAKEAARPIAERVKLAAINGDYTVMDNLSDEEKKTLDAAGMSAELAGYSKSEKRDQLSFDIQDAAENRRLDMENSNTGFDKMLAQANKMETEYDARRFMEDPETAIRFGINPEVMRQRAGEVAQKWTESNKMSNADAQELSSYAEIAQNNASAIEAKADSVRAQVFAENVLDPPETWASSVKVSDAATVAAANDWDKTNFGGLDLGPTLEKAAEEFIKEQGLTGEAANLKGAFAKRAVEMMGTPSEWVGQENIDGDAVKLAMGKAYTEYLGFQGRKANRDRAEIQYQAEKNAALTMRNSVGKYRKLLQENAQSNLRGE